MKIRVYYDACKGNYIIQYKLFGLIWRNWRAYTTCYDGWVYKDFIFSSKDEAINWVNNKKDEILNKRKKNLSRKSEVVYQTEF